MQYVLEQYVVLSELDFLEKEIEAIEAEYKTSLKHLPGNDLIHLRQSLYARIIKSFAIATKLYFFNPRNSRKARQIRAEIIDCITSGPYKTALSNISLRNLEPKLIAVVFACKLRAVGALKMMYRLQYKR